MKVDIGLLNGIYMTENITLAVPTFNRKDAVVENSRHILDGIKGMPVKYLVVDNNSEDGTYENLVGEFGHNEQATFIKNSKNLGYFGNFLKLLKYCETKYIIISSDEDLFLTENIQPLIDFVKEKKPAMVSSQVRFSGRSGLYRGRTKRSIISPKDIRGSANYVSGLLFDLDRVKSAIHFLEENCDNPMVVCYPQVIVASFLALQEDIYWFDLPLTKKVYQLDSTIVDCKGLSYASISSRIEQFQSFDKILSLMATTEKEKKIARRIRAENFYLLLSLLRESVYFKGSPSFLDVYEIRLLSYCIRSISISFLKKLRIK